MQIADSKGIFVGGSSGMALATAEAFVKGGGKAAILDLPSSSGADVASSLGGTFHPVDVMDWEGTEKALDAAVAALGGVHFIVNTAGGGIAKRTLGKDYFVKIAFRMSQPKLDKAIQDKINLALGSFAAVSQANALVQQAQRQADALRKVSNLYRNNPALVELEKWRIICGVSSTTSTETSPGCKNMTILAGTDSNVIVGGGSGAGSGR